ncbi:MAG: type II secretion system protein N [Granulosicoccus sp.]
MRIVWLVIVGLVAYLIGVIALFPAAPVVDRIKPQLGLIALDGVHGKLYNGVIDSVRSTDDLLPLQFSNVGWTLSPKTLISGGAGASFRFDGYGGQGEGLAARQWNGDIKISDFRFAMQAKELEPLLPVPIASFSGLLTGDIRRLLLVKQLLKEFEGTLSWTDAKLESPVPTALGNVNVQITPDGEQTHVVNLEATGGDIAMQGTVTLTLSGDFSADVLFTPSPGAPPDVVNGLRQMGRADAEGRVRLVREGNVNRLM